MLTTGHDRSLPTNSRARKRLGTKPDFLWDGVRDDGKNMRFSMLPGRAADDLNLTCVHFRVLAYLGRFNHQKGWCKLSQTDLSERFGVRRQAVNKAVRELVEWGYLAKRSQEESRESFCFYRTIIDGQDDAEGVSATADTPPREGVSATADTSVRSRRTRVSPLRTPNSYRSFDVVDEERATCDQSRPSGTDGVRRILSAGRQMAEREGRAKAADEHAIGERLPFSADVIRELVGWDVNVEELIARYLERTDGKTIRDPSAYLLRMGKDEAAKRLGVSTATLAKIGSRNSGERATALAAAVDAFSKPSDDCIARARRYRNPYVETALRRLAGKTFATAAAADRAFEGELTVLRFSIEARRTAA